MVSKITAFCRFFIFKNNYIKGSSYNFLKLVGKICAFCCLFIFKNHFIKGISSNFLKLLDNDQQITAYQAEVAFVIANES